MNEIVYILINEAMPSYVKLGKTSNLEQRIRGLDNTSAPLPFECFYAARVKDASFVEKQLHDAFGDHRVRSNREFFRISPERIASALRIAALEDVTPVLDYVESEEDQKVLDKAKQRRANFNFQIVDIYPGSVLKFTRDEQVTCVVVDKRRVKFENEIMSLSLAAQIALERQGVNWKSVQGTLYWEYESETLVERRVRIEEEED